MSAWNWRAGQAAVCIESHHVEHHGVVGDVVARQVYRVNDVAPYGNLIMLAVDGQPGYWSSNIFRPVQPATDEFKQQLAALRPRVKQSEPA